MRPERAVVKKAIVDAGGNKRKAAILLGCSRQSLYTWIYQFGLERLAGVCIDTRPELDTRSRQDTQARQQRQTTVYSAETELSTLRLVQGETAVADYPVQATVRLRGSLWKLTKIEAIRRNKTAAELVEEGLE